MATWYIDLESGNDSNDGSSWAQAKLTTKSLSLPLGNGDEIRIAKSDDPVLVGNATWTDGSTAVTLAAPSGSLSTDHFVSRTSQAWWGEWPWHSIASISGTDVTLSRKYRGPSGTFPLYMRMPARPTPTTGVLLGFGAAGGSTFTATGCTMSGGWNTSSGLQDGQTFVDGQTKQGCSLRVIALQSNGGRIDVTRLSFARFDTQSLSGYTVPTGTVEIDNAIENNGYGFVYGSGNLGQHGTCRVNHVCGNGGNGLHVHSSFDNTIVVNKLFDNFDSNLTQNNDFEWHIGNVYDIGETAYSPYGLGGGPAAFNFVNSHNITVDSVHDCTTAGLGIEATGANIFRILDSRDNPRDIDFSPSSWVLGDPGADPPVDPLTQEQLDAIPQRLISCGLYSPVPIYNPHGLTISVEGLTATSTVLGDLVVLSGYRILGATITSLQCLTGPATFGDVQYPSNETWTVSVTGLFPGTQNFRIGDGTYTVDVSAFVIDTTLQITVIEPIYGGYRLHGVIQEGRTLIIAP